MSKLTYLFGRLLTLWKRSRLVADVLARRLFFRLLASPHLLSVNESLSPKPIQITSEARLMVLGPHSDDESIGCGGLLARYASQIQVVCLTDGAKGDPNHDRSALIALRQQELRAAMSIAGDVTVTFLGIHDQALAKHYADFSRLDITDVDMIFLPNFLDQHPDHKAVTTHLQRLLRGRSYRPTLKIAFYEVWGALPVWNAYVELDPETRHQKQAMINCFTSQTRQIDYASRIDSLHVYRGIAVAKSAVEAYLVLDVVDFLAIQ